MPIQEARQDRSRLTFNKLLDATEALLNEKTFDDISVREVVERAGSSIGSFYARFSDKEALRDCLIERYHDDLLDLSVALLEPAKWEGKGMAPRAEMFVRGVVETCRKRYGLMRMRSLYQISHPGGATATDLGKTREFVQRLEAFFSPCVSEITHPHPDLALAFALRLVDTMVATTVLFDRQRETSYRDINDETLIKETTRAFLTYLGVVQA